MTSEEKRLIKDTMEQLYVIYYEAVNEGCDGKIVEAYYNQWKGAYKLMNVLGIKGVNVRRVSKKRAKEIVEKCLHDGIYVSYCYKYMLETDCYSKASIFPTVDHAMKDQDFINYCVERILYARHYDSLGNAPYLQVRKEVLR